MVNYVGSSCVGKFTSLIQYYSNLICVSFYNLGYYNEQLKNKKKNSQLKM